MSHRLLFSTEMGYEIVHLSSAMKMNGSLYSKPWVTPIWLFTKVIARFDLTIQPHFLFQLDQGKENPGLEALQVENS